MECKLNRVLCSDGQSETVVVITKSYVFKFSDFVIDKLPENCYQCLCGYHTIPGHPCGRNVPWTKEDAQHRPATCKLRSLDEFLKEES